MCSIISFLTNTFLCDITFTNWNHKSSLINKEWMNEWMKMYVVFWKRRNDEFFRQLLSTELKIEECTIYCRDRVFITETVNCFRFWYFLMTLLFSFLMALFNDFDSMLLSSLMVILTNWNKVNTLYLNKLKFNSIRVLFVQSLWQLLKLLLF